MTIGQSIAEPLQSLEPHLTRRDVNARVTEIMEKVGLDPAWLNRYPRGFSGGQTQPVGVARPMSLRPTLSFCAAAPHPPDAPTQAPVLAAPPAPRATLGQSP